MTRFIAKVNKVGSIIEEEVEITVGGYDIICFAVFCPYKIEANQCYLVEFYPKVWDDYHIDEIDILKEDIVRLDDDYSYMIYGKLEGNILKVGGLEFEDEVFMFDFPYLDGKYVAWRIDRLDVGFV